MTTLDCGLENPAATWRSETLFRPKQTQTHSLGGENKPIMQTFSISFPNRCLKSESELTVFGFLAYLGISVVQKKPDPHGDRIWVLRSWFGSDGKWDLWLWRL